MSSSPLALLSGLQLQEHAAEPYFVQLRRQIEELVRSGALPVGTCMPSERELADALHIGRSIVRHCYILLRDTHWLLSKGRRLGTVVRGVPAPSDLEVEGMPEPVREQQALPQPERAHAHVLERAHVSDGAIASLFNRTSDSAFLRLVRLRRDEGGTPLAREVAWYDLGLVPAMADWSGEGSAQAYLREHCGLEPVRAKQSIEAVTSSREETRAFGLAAPVPCLLLKRQTYTAAGQQVAYAESVFRGDAWRYQFEVGQGAAS